MNWLVIFQVNKLEGGAIKLTIVVLAVFTYYWKRVNWDVAYACSSNWHHPVCSVVNVHSIYRLGRLNSKVDTANCLSNTKLIVLYAQYFYCSLFIVCIDEFINIMHKKPITILTLLGDYPDLTNNFRIKLWIYCEWYRLGYRVWW